MRHIFKILFYSIIVFNCFTIRAQVIQKDDMAIDAYYGMSNVSSLLLKRVVSNASNVLNFHYGSLGPLGGKFEYMVTEEIGLGVDFNYTLTSFKFDQVNSDSLGNVTDTSNIQLSISNFRGMGRLNVHFIDNYYFDGYFILGLGYNFAKIPEANEFDINDILPVAFRIGIGGRYFFKEKLGVNLEVGLGGGGLIQGGISFKI